MKNVRFLAAALAALAVCASAAVAQAYPPPLDTPDPPPIVQRVTDLERDALATKERVAALEKMVPSIPKTAPSSPADVKDEWVVPQFPGVTFTKSQLSAMYPGIRFNATASAPVVAASDPFADGCREGCSLIQTIGVTRAGTPGTQLTYGLAPEGAAGTNTSARGVVRAGGISGCSAAGCATAGSATGRGGWYLGKNLGR